MIVCSKLVNEVNVQIRCIYNVMGRSDVDDLLKEGLFEYCACGIIWVVDDDELGVRFDKGSEVFD
jgi:hypothetical protein